ncbi:MAG: FtsW/RodA/SpoVE family cell cycle protein [Ruminococcus sp.]|nr:FtsW/RodA/SpoVE family cell cycle protein [Ruminococcus sp.]
MNRLLDDFKHSDRWLSLLTALALGYSFVLIGSMQRAGSYPYLRPQMIAAVTGLSASVLLACADYRLLLKKWKIAAIVGLLMAGAVFVFGIRVSGTDDTAWIALPWGLTVQPSELMKVCFILTFTQHLSYLSEKGKTDKPLWVLTLLLHAALPVGLIHLQGDDGTALIFCMIAVLMAAFGHIRARYFLLLGASAAAGLPVLWLFIMNDAQRSRLLALAFAGEASDYGWQQYQGKLSIAKGGLYGSGLFQGTRVAEGIVPEQENDFILTVAGEELGFIGCLALMALLLGIILRVLLAVRRAGCLQGELLCAGVFAVIASQTVMNIGMVLGLLPVIGVTLPLFSAGGSSVISTLLCIGLVQSVYTHRTATDVRMIRRTAVRL